MHESELEKLNTHLKSQVALYDQHRESIAIFTRAVVEGFQETVKAAIAFTNMINAFSLETRLELERWENEGGLV